MNKAEKLRKELINAARTMDWPEVRSDGFERRVLARLSVADKPETFLSILGWAARTLSPAMGLILLVLTGVSMMPGDDDWASLFTTMASYIIFGVSL